MHEGPQIWSVFDRKERLVLAVSDEPGEFNFAQLPDEGADPVFCNFATIQCYDATVESEVLGILTRSQSAQDIIELLQAAGFRVIEGRPKVASIARL